METTDELLQQYMQRLTKLRYSVGSVRGYSSTMRSFLLWKEKACPQSTLLCKETIKGYIRHCLSEGRSRAHCDMLISAMKIMHVQIMKVDRSNTANMRQLINEVEEENAASPSA